MTTWLETAQRTVQEAIAQAAPRADPKIPTMMAEIAQALALIAITKQLETIARELKSINNYLGIMKS